MKRLLTTTLLLFLFVGVFAQNSRRTSAFREITQPSIEVLSMTQHTRLEKLKQSDNYLKVTLIKLENLQQALNKGDLSFGLGISEKVTTKNLDYSSKNDFKWEGTFKNGEAFLIHENGRTYGQIRKEEAVFDIQYLENDFVILIEYDMEKLNKIGCANQTEHNNFEGNNEHNNLTSPEVEGSNPVVQQSFAGASSVIVRALVLFTPAAQATGMNMTDLANTARTQWQTALTNSSGYSTILQIAGVQPLNFIETDDRIRKDVLALRNNINAQQLRDQFEADIVILFTDGDYPGIGGVAFFGPLNDLAYGIVQVANATSTFTFIHETGHIFGAYHEFAESQILGENHGHEWQKTTGWWWWQKTKKYGSIMRRQQSGRTRVSHFSNPSVTHQGKATGVTGVSFNTRVINQNGQIVCDFRINPPAVNIYGTGSANNGDNLRFTSSVSQGNAPYTYQWQVDTGGGFYTVGSSTSLSISMAFNNDLYLRLTVTDADGRVDTDTHTVTNLFLGGGCTICPDSTLLDTSPSEELFKEEILQSIDLLVYPNPTSKYLQISFPNDSEFPNKYQVVDLTGKTVLESKIKIEEMNNGSIKLDTTPLKPDIYTIILSGNNMKRTLRFIKQ